MSDRNKARVSEFLDRVLTGGDIEATGDYFERDMVEEMPSQDRVRDCAEGDLDVAAFRACLLSVRDLDGCR
jgi:hypothetical protein